jgi:excisionase family DNA binding protein
MPRLESPDRETVDVRKAAARLGVSKVHLYDEIRAGRFPVIRIGRRVLIPKSYLDSLLSQGGGGA